MPWLYHVQKAGSDKEAQTHNWLNASAKILNLVRIVINGWWRSVIGQIIEILSL